ncbi:MAG TPA: CBS domain-containing protein [Acidimicrobiia bacterium]|nr:CBS domain-containing protein [Acidimicrobiia bacterium]
MTTPIPTDRERGSVSLAPDDQARNLIVRPAVFVHLDDSLRRLSETLAEELIGAAVVRDTHPPALVSERDVIRAIAEGGDLDETRVRDVMTEDVLVVAPKDQVLDVAYRMLDNEIRHIPVVEDDVVVGLISGRDALRVFADQARVKDGERS